MLLVGALASAGQWVMDGVGMKDHRTTPAPELAAPNGATSQVDLEMAYDKATRPWFKKKRLVLPLSLMLLVVIIAAVNAGGERGSSSSTAGSSQSEVEGTPQADKVVAGIGTKVRDGKFEFVVTGVERPGKTYPGKLQTTLTARGEFVIVRVNVTNIGKQEQGLDSQSQFLSNDKGQTIEPSSAILYTKDALKFVQLIEPGSTVKGAPVVFDVAPGTKIVNVELHDAPCSQGAKVKLS